MPKPQHFREAYNAALRFERLLLRLINDITPTHPEEAAELAEYSNQMMRGLRRSNNCIGTKKGQQQSIQAAVWMVEVLIILNYLGDNNVARSQVTAAVELLERIEEALRVECSLPPARE